MSYSYSIYDHDVGDNVFDKQFASDAFVELCKTVQCDLDYDFESEMQFSDDEEAFDAELKMFDQYAILRSLKNFDFCKGFVSWHCMLPGAHREMIVEFVQ